MSQETQRQSKRRNKRIISEKISPTLDPAALSELVVWVFWWWAHAWCSGCPGGGHMQKGAGPLSFYTFLVPVS